MLMTPLLIDPLMMKLLMHIFISTYISSDNSWLIHLGGSYYMIPHKEWFSNYKSCDGEDVFIGDIDEHMVILRGGESISNNLLLF